MKILTLDSSSKYGSIALCDGGELVAEYTTRGIINQNEKITSVISRILADVDCPMSSLDAFGVVRGPGSFTGIRVGVATVQGLAFATGRPAYGISSLKALALGCLAGDLPVCTVMDAKKDEIYAALYQREGDDVRALLPEQAAEPRAFLSQLSGPMVFVGDGAGLLAPLVEQHPRIRAQWPMGSSGLCRASVVGAWLDRQLSLGAEDGLEPAQPLYLRASAAELRLRKWKRSQTA